MFESGQRVKGLSNETDIVPTLLEMLGYDLQGEEYPGYSLLHEPPEDRTLRFNCISERKCLASIKGNEKYIYHYDNQPEEVFDLSADPLEEHNLAGEYSKEDLDKRREDLLAWRSSVNTVYESAATNSQGGGTP
jgi:arylsulfatase A-like enzyme